jgi:hypothetical protein
MDNLTGPAAYMNTGLDKTIDKLQKMEQGYSNMAKTGAGTMLIGKEITEAAIAPVAATFDTRRALGELAQVGVKDLQAIEKAALDFSNSWSRTTKSEFITASYDIKSGISSLTDHAVGEYTAMSGITAKATKSTTAEMTNLFAIGHGIYKKYYNDMSDTDFGSMFAASIADTVQRYRSDGTKVSQSIQSLGATATSANVPLEEQLTILGMLGQTMSGSEAGTKYNAFLKSAAKAGDELGLSFVDVNNQLLSMPEILMILKSKYGETVDAVEKLEIQKAFGTVEAVAAIDLLYDKTGELQGNILSLYGALGQGIELPTAMAQPVNTAEGERWETMKQKMHNIVELMGTGLLPSFNDVLDKGHELADGMGVWIGEHQNLVTNVLILIAVLGSFIGVLGATQLIIGTTGTILFKTFGNLKAVAFLLKGPFETIILKSMYAGDAIKLFGGRLLAGAGVVKGYVFGLASMAKQAIITGVQAIPALVSSVWSFTTALLSNPITWYVVGAMVLVGALYLLWKHWDTVTEFVSNKFNSAMNGAANVMNWLKAKVDAMPQGFVNLLSVIFPFVGVPLNIIKNWEKIPSFFKNVWSGVKTGYNDFTKEFIPDLLNSGGKMMTTLGDGIKKKLSVPYDTVKEGLSNIRKMLPFSDAKEGPLSTLTLSGKRVFETITTGMNLTKHLPAQVTNEAFSDMTLEPEEKDYSLPKRKPKGGGDSILSEVITILTGKDDPEDDDDEPKVVENHYHFDKFVIDLNKVDQIPRLVRMMKEVEEYVNANKTTEAKPV